MNIPNHVHFGLGFGFKYQHLLTTLLHALIREDNLLSDKSINNACKKYMIKKLAQNSYIHANPKKFMESIEKVFPNLEKLNYKKDSLLLIEGEDSCFEDINLFTTYDDDSKIIFIQVKGSDSQSAKYNLEKAIIKTLNSMLKNDNKNIPYNLIILINEEVTAWYYLREKADKVKMINTILEPFIQRIKCSAFIKNKIITIFDDYLNKLYLKGCEENIFDYFKRKLTANQYEKVEVILRDNDEYIVRIFQNICGIMENTKVIDKLDHRLIYLFLKYHYGNDKLTKILWNIEMKSMSGEPTQINDIQNRLISINFERTLIEKIKFTKNSSKSMFNKGKIL